MKAITRSSCALRGDEAVFWVSVGQQWLVLSQCEVDRVLRRYQMLIDVTGSVEGIMPLYTGGDWSGVTDALLTD